MGRKVKYIAVIMISIFFMWQQAQVSYADDQISAEPGVEAVESNEKADGDKTDDTEKEDGTEENNGTENGGDSEVEEKPTELYQIDFRKADGKNGYYRTKPEVMITHQDERAVTKFRLINPENQEKQEPSIEDELSMAGEKFTIPEEKFSEGKNRLSIWMEDQDGQKIENTESEKEFLIDTCPPDIQASVPAGFDTWYKKGVVLSASGEDAVSGVDHLSCVTDGKMIGETPESHEDFYIDRVSRGGKAVKILVKAEDKAGNQSERIWSVYIDNEAPHIRINGAQEYMITSQPVTATYDIEEDNILQEFWAQTEWEDVQGEKAAIPVEEWTKTNIGRQAVQNFTEDGIYKIRLKAADKAGYTTESSRQIIIDQMNPIIRHVDELDHSYLKKFVWDYPQNEIIQDFTTYTYEISLDGQLYPMGKSVTTEGKHDLEVKAIDAAGNEAVAKAEFVIDHTDPDIIFTDIAEGEEYEEERTFRIAVTGQDDRITRIRINGKDQKLNSQSKAYQYTLKESNTYEVEVAARDKAGNVSEKSVMFKVVPKETLIQKMAKPFQKSLSGEKEAKPENAGKHEEKPGRAWMVVVGICLAAGAGYILYRKRKNK